jgi:hypothetical protein
VPGPTDPDTKPPVISNVRGALLGQTSARFTWTTDKPSFCVRGAGRNASDGYPIYAVEGGYATDHNLTITGLPMSPVAHFAIKAKDRAGNICSTEDMIL